MGRPVPGHIVHAYQHGLPGPCHGCRGQPLPHHLSALNFQTYVASLPHVQHACMHAGSLPLGILGYPLRCVPIFFLSRSTGTAVLNVLSFIKVSPQIVALTQIECRPCLDGLLSMLSLV